MKILALVGNFSVCSRKIQPRLVPVTAPALLLAHRSLELGDVRLSPIRVYPTPKKPVVAPVQGNEVIVHLRTQRQ
jgi:hypothetical protein